MGNNEKESDEPIDPCKKVKQNGDPDRFFNVENEFVIQCKLDQKTPDHSKRDKYRLYKVYDKQKFDAFNIPDSKEQLKILLVNPAFEADIKRREKLKKKIEE